MDLPFWFRVAVGPAEISARFRGETVSNGLQATWTPYWALRRHYTGSSPRTLCMCARDHLRSVPAGPRAAARARVRARGEVGVGQIMCMDDGEVYAHARQ